MTTATLLYPLPVPRTNEAPAAYADRVGQWHCSTADQDRRREFGQYLTPLPIARFMASLLSSEKNEIRILDPGAGSGVLCCALCEALASGPTKPRRIEICACETDESVAEPLAASLRHTRSWLSGHGIEMEFEIRTEDFLLAHAHALDDQPALFRNSHDVRLYDVVVSNPPYFKLSKSDPRARLASAVVHGQPNIYALFMAVSAALLRPDGQLIFITPRSYASGPYFRRLRERFFATMRPVAIHLFASRTETFSRDEVLQESVILSARRQENWWQTANSQKAEISASNGASDLAERSVRCVSLSKVLRYDSVDKVLHIPISHLHDRVWHAVRSWPGSLHAYGLEISTGPVVAFRAATLLSKQGELPAQHAPLLWMQNVRPMETRWPVDARGKEQYIRLCQEARPLLLPNRNYVLLQRFSAKEQSRRLVAAPLLAQRFSCSLVGLENHLNYIYRPSGNLSEEEAYGLAALFNSALLDAYFRTSNGNTQVSATEIRAMPLPPPEIISAIGRTAIQEPFSFETIDDLLHHLFGWAKSSDGPNRAHNVQA